MAWRRLTAWRHRQRRLGLKLLVAGCFLASFGTAFGVREATAGNPVEVGPGSSPPPHSTAPIPGAGASVPAYDLSSDPVFPTLDVGYAIESHSSEGETSEHLARSEDGGRSWYLVGSPFPFSGGYAEVQFQSVRTGYAFGPAGLAVTYDGGRSWDEGAALGGSLERVVPIGDNVWATYAVCHGPPVASTPCNVRLAVSTNGGLSWHAASHRSPLVEALSGGDVLARDTLTKAYVVSYGPTGGGLAVTSDSGRSWRRLPDPCAEWRTVDLAVLNDGHIWMICGGSPVLGGSASAKAVLRSSDYGKAWTLEASTGFAPPLQSRKGMSPGIVGRIFYDGSISQLATISPERAWIGVSGLGVIVTFDGGRIWEKAAGLKDDGHEGGVGVTFNDEVHGWAIEFNEGVWQTTDGVHWRLIDGS